MIRRPPRSTQSRSSAASDVYKRQQQSSHPAHYHPPPWPWTISGPSARGLSCYALPLWHPIGVQLLLPGRPDQTKPEHPSPPPNAPPHLSVPSSPGADVPPAPALQQSLLRFLPRLQLPAHPCQGPHEPEPTQPSHHALSLPLLPPLSPWKPTQFVSQHLWRCIPGDGAPPQLKAPPWVQDDQNPAPPYSLPPEPSPSPRQSSSLYRAASDLH